MQVINAKIKNVTIGFDDRERLSVRMNFDGEATSCTWGFVLINPVQVKNLIKLMEYTEVREVKNLEGKIIRVVFKEIFLRGFGHPVDDKFIPLTGIVEPEEVTLKELSKIIET